MSDKTEPWKWGDEGKPKPEYKEPTGRHLCCGMDAEMRPFEQGDWIPYNEYARINERWEFIHRLDSLAIKKQKEEIERLKAEVERLTKAGDLMCRMAGNNQVINRHWKTAKKGVQS
jgi:hypothetical protein